MEVNSCRASNDGMCTKTRVPSSHISFCRATASAKALMKVVRANTELSMWARSRFRLHMYTREKMLRSELKFGLGGGVGPCYVSGLPLRPDTLAQHFHRSSLKVNVRDKRGGEHVQTLARRLCPT